MSIERDLEIMNNNLDRIIVAVERLVELAEAAANPVGVATPVVDAAEPPARKRGRPRKLPVEVLAQPVAAPTIVLADSSPVLDFLSSVPAIGTPTAPPIVGTAVPLPTKDNVRTALIAYQNRKALENPADTSRGKDATFALINKHGGTNMNDLPESNYAALIKEAS